MKVIFFGASDFSVPFLKSIYDSGHKITLCVTGKDKMRGRGSKIKPDPVKKVAGQLGIDTFEADKLDSSAIDAILKVNFEYLILVSFGKILPSEFLNKTDGRTINVHPSLLPKYRGPSPIITPLLNGDTETGISLIKISHEIDEGDIYSQRRMKISPYDNKDTLEKKLIGLGTVMLPGLIDEIGKKGPRTYPQKSNGASYTKIFSKSDLKINWNNEPLSIHNHVRAFSTTPGCTTTWKDKSLKILQTDPVLLTDNTLFTKENNGTVIKADNSGIFIKCGSSDEGVEENKKMIAVLSLKPQNSNIMSHIDFINGYQIKPGDLFE